MPQEYRGGCAGPKSVRVQAFQKGQQLSQGSGDMEEVIRQTRPHFGLIHDSACFLGVSFQVTLAPSSPGPAGTASRWELELMTLYMTTIRAS